MIGILAGVLVGYFLPAVARLEMNAWAWIVISVVPSGVVIVAVTILLGSLLGARINRPTPWLRASLFLASVCLPATAVALLTAPAHAGAETLLTGSDPPPTVMAVTGVFEVVLYVIPAVIGVVSLLVWWTDARRTRGSSTPINTAARPDSTSLQ